MYNFFKDCKTLDEAKKLYKQLALKLHPDKGGKTKDFQDLLNEFHNFKPQEEKFKGEFDKWDAQKFTDIVEQLQKIKGIDIVIYGSWIWLEGNTKPVKEQIKAVRLYDFMKRGFSKNKKQWYFSPLGYKKKGKRELSYNEIKDLYGAKKEKEENGTRQLKVA